MQDIFDEWIWLAGREDEAHMQLFLKLVKREKPVLEVKCLVNFLQLGIPFVRAPDCWVAGRFYGRECLEK